MRSSTFQMTALLVLATACGEEPVTHPGCTLTLAGALTGSGKCGASVYYAASTHLAYFRFGQGSSMKGIRDVRAFVEFSAGKPVTGSFTEHWGATDSARSSIYVQSKTFDLWEASRRHPEGTFKLSLTSLGTPLPGEGLDQIYPDAHGSLDATVPAAGPVTATGTVTIHATF